MRYYSIILEDLAFKHSLRIYCIDRPGVGMSHTTEPEVITPFFLESEAACHLVGYRPCQ